MIAGIVPYNVKKTRLTEIYIRVCDRMGVMIRFLRGIVIAKTRGEMVLDVRDVGYKVAVGVRVYEEFGLGEKVELYIYTAVREDAILP